MSSSSSAMRGTGRVEELDMMMITMKKEGDSKITRAFLSSFSFSLDLLDRGFSACLLGGVSRLSVFWFLGQRRSAWLLLLLVRCSWETIVVF